MNNFLQLLKRVSVQSALLVFLTLTGIANNSIAQSSNANLSGLVLSDGTISPSFDKNNLNYTASVSNSTAYIYVVPSIEDPTAVVKVNDVVVVPDYGSDYIALNVGSNAISVEVIAEDNTTVKTYSINVHRLGNTNIAINLFPQGTLVKYKNGPADVNYQATVSPGNTSVQIQPMADDPSTVVTVNGDAVSYGDISPEIALTGNSTFINIKATTADGLIQNYSVLIKKSGYQNAKATFKLSSKTSLTQIPSGPAAVNYETTVNAATYDISVFPQPENPNSTVTVNDIIVPTGTESDYIVLNDPGTTPTLISIVVTSEDGSHTKSYSIKVNRKLSSNTDAAFVLNTKTQIIKAVTGPASVNYTTTVDFATTMLTVEPRQVDINSVVYVNGVITPFKTASAPITLSTDPTVIAIEVHAPNGSIKTYSITVTKSGSNNANANISLSTKSILEITYGPANFNYAAFVPVDISTLTVTANSLDPNATVYINGVLTPRKTASAPIEIAADDLTFIDVEVHAQDGVTVKTYSIMVLPFGSGNYNATFKLSPNAMLVKVPSCGCGGEDYVAGVDPETTSITITPKAQDPDATIYINDELAENKVPSAPIPLTGTYTTIYVDVYSPVGAAKTYSITVAKTGSNNANATFSLNPNSLLTNASGTADVNYATTVDDATTSLTLKPKTVDANAILTVNGEAVAQGASAQIALNASGITPIDVVVKAQDGVTVKTYSIAVSKTGSNNANAVFALSTRSKLIETNTGPAKTNYTASVDMATTSITVTPKTRDANASVTINGVPAFNQTPSDPIALLTDNTLIQIQILAQDGVTSNTYSIMVTKADDAGRSSGDRFAFANFGDNIMNVAPKNATAEQKGITIYPNPFVDVVKIDMKGYKATQAGVDIRNMQGMPVFNNKMNINEGKLEVDLTKLGAGIYTINLNIDNERKSYKIFKN